MDPSTLNTLAKRLRSLHQPGNPVVLVNVWDAPSAAAAAANPSTKALTTASWAVAAVRGLADNAMSYEDNLSALRIVSHAAHTTNPEIPLAADLQDGYADIGHTIRQAIATGIVGANIEDVNNATDRLRDVDDAVSRIRAAIAAAKEAGVPDFVVNARTDVLGFGGSVDDAIARGKAYLEAGAVSVYIWGGPKGRGVSREEVSRLVQGLGGMINVKMNLRPGFLNAKDLAELGVARISVGPELHLRAMDGFKAAMNKMLNGESFE